MLVFARVRYHPRNNEDCEDGGSAVHSHSLDIPWRAGVGEGGPDAGGVADGVDGGDGGGGGSVFEIHASVTT